MKRQLLGVAAILLSISTYAQDNPLWMRYCAISPDGTTIAFTYKGDIYTVPSTGGRASQITTNPAHDTKPIWSPDGKKIAFASDRMGSMDIFEVNKEGGIPKRLTTHSGNETPVAYKDAGHILFLANIMPTAEDAQFPSGQFQQVYEVNTEGGRPILFSSMPMEDISINHTGNTLLYHDKKGYEDPWRKHHTSSITRDIWLCSLNGNRTFRKQTAFNGEDRTPVWASDDKSFYYLSEEKGSFNIFKRDIDGNTSKQITNHTKHPVRFLSAASNGTLCYGYDGEIYTVKEGAIPQKVQISIVTDKNDKDLIRQIKRNGATEISLSPDAKEIAFVLRGDVYVTSTEYSTTKQITNTPQQERDIHFSPDGRSIVYASERNGLWQIYQTSLAKKEEKQFAYATDIKEERLTNSDITSFQPQYSPDGKEVAFLENRTTIRVLNLKSKAVRTVMDGKYEYSYSDGDQWYQWSPDSKWILTNYIGIGGWNNKDVALVNASGNGEIHNLTESGYSDGNAKWVLDGKAMIWESDRAGFRSHGSWGAEADIYIMFFDLDAYDRFRMSKEELALLEDSEKKDKEKSEEKEKADHKKDKKKDSKKEDDKKEVKPLVFDLENSRDRVIRLTVNSSRLGDAVLTPKGDKLYYQAAFESGYDLWEHDLKENKTKIVMKKVGGGALLPDKKGENLFLCSQGGIKKVTVSSGETKPVEFEAFFATPFKMYQNIGATMNRGIEISVNTVNVDNKNFKWNSTLTFAANHEEITDLIDGKDIIGSDSHITTSLLIGRPLKSFYHFINEGIWQENEAEEAAKYFKDSKKTQPFKPGDIKLRDLNGDYIIDDKDETYLGSQSPKWTGGFNNNFSYKNFDLNVYIIARWGQMIDYELTGSYDPQGKGNFPAYLNYWTPENPSNDFPRPAQTNFYNYLGYQTLNYIDGSYWKIKTVSLGYTFPKSLTSKLGVSKLRAYVTANNLFSFAKNHLIQDYDAERGGSAKAPLQRQFIFGLNLDF